MDRVANDVVAVWDRFVRICHWTVVVAYAIAYFGEGEPAVLHAWAGYLVGALVVLRIGWGFVGPRYARFSDFVWRPGAVVAYLRDLVLFRAPRHLGHSPAGGAMVVLLLVFLAAAVATGVAAWGEQGRGPLASWFADAAVAVGADGEGGDGGVFTELHDAISNLSFILVLAHLGGVALASFVHRENLPRAMVTGRKRAR
ncbi:MAG: cytochrome b/b6 domain-containing protein [Alphaproteobacteria bacterium]